MPKSPLSKNIINILSIARLAPSVHNIQPWQVKVEDNLLIIEPHPGRLLKFGDPVGRQSAISLGIFCEACVLALSQYFLAVSEVLVKDRKIVLKTVERKNKPTIREDIEALERRFSDRSQYKKINIDNLQIIQINSSWRSEAVSVKTVDDTKIINRCADLTKRGLTLALSSPDFRKELVEYFVPNSTTPYGIPTDGLPGNPIRNRLIGRLIESGLGSGKEAKAEYKRWASASALVFVLSKGDTYPFWIESGRAYLRASLAIEKLGLRQATSAAIVEAADFHEDIESLLGTNMRIQCILRIGQSDSLKKPSGRYLAEELLVT